MKLDLPVSQETLTRVAKIDHFQGKWSSWTSIPSERLPRLEEASQIQSAGSSCRLAGIRVTDQEVAAVLRGEDVALRESPEIDGYSRAFALPELAPDTLITGDWIRRLHAVLMGDSIDGAGPSPWRSESRYREAFDSNGQAMGHVYPTLPPRMVAGKTEDLLTWLELELRSGDQHALLVVGAFLLCFLAVSPFETGNGRLTRLLATRLLLRAGYTYVPYASIEALFEETRDEYYQTLGRSQTRLWTDDANPGPWLEYFLKVLDFHRERVEAKVELEREVRDYPPLQRRILETIREHGNVDAALLIKATGANRNTLKDNLRRLVRSGVLEKTGQRRGTRYRMGTGAQPVSPAGGGISLD